jgi:hypothetical protein
LLGLLAFGLALAGCGADDGPRRTLSWDFRDGHTLAVTPQFDTDLDAQDIRPIAHIDFRFPDGTRWRATGDDVRRVAPERDGRVVTDVLVISQPRTAEAAYALAERWAHVLHVPTTAILRWRMTGYRDHMLAESGRDDTLGFGGPVPSIEMQSSFEDDEPFLVEVDLYWPASAA